MFGQKNHNNEQINEKGLLNFDYHDNVQFVNFIILNDLRGGGFMSIEPSSYVGMVIGIGMFFGGDGGGGRVWG